MFSSLFRKKSKFLVPTDEEISALAGGIKIVSLRSSDLVNIFDDLNARVRKITQFLKNKSGFLIAEETAKLIDQEIAGALISDEIIIIFKPNKNLLFSNYVSSATGIPESLISRKINTALPSNDFNYIVLQHEISHVLDYSQKKSDITDYSAELRADSYAIKQYKESGGTEEGIDAYIYKRALSGFLTQPSRYFLAPRLASEFSRSIHPYFNHSSHEFQVTECYYELRLRMAALVEGDEKTALEMSSQAIRKHIKITPSSVSIINHALLAEYGDIVIGGGNKFLNHLFENLEDGEYLFSLLGHISKEGRLDSTSRACAEQIMDAARHLCPRLLVPHEERLAQLKSVQKPDRVATLSI